MHTPHAGTHVSYCVSVVEIHIGAFIIRIHTVLSYLHDVCGMHGVHLLYTLHVLHSFQYCIAYLIAIGAGAFWLICEFKEPRPIVNVSPGKISVGFLCIYMHVHISMYIYVRVWFDLFGCSCQSVCSKDHYFTNTHSHADRFLHVKGR